MKLFNGILHELRSINFFALIVTALIIFPQNGYPEIFSGGLNFNVVTPKNEFKDNLDRNGYGISGNALFTPNPLVPLKIGVELGYANYGIEKRNEPFSYSIPDVTVSVSRNNNIFLGHLLLRAQKEIGIVSPYVDGLFGLTYLWTDTKIEGLENLEQITSSKNISDIALSYGFGGGMMFKVWTAGQYMGNLTDVGSVYIDLKVRYLYGGEAEYLKKGAISVGDNGKVTYDISKSTTDMMLYQIGIAVGF